LGVAVSADAAEITRKYRELSSKFHPDKCEIPGCEEAMKKINMAKDTLTDPQKRFDYNMKHNFENSCDQMNSKEQDLKRRQQKETKRRRQKDAKQEPKQKHNSRPSSKPKQKTDSREEKSENLLTKIFVILKNILYNETFIIIFLVFCCSMLLLPYLIETGPKYSFEKTRDYMKLRQTGKSGIHYYVKNGFDEKHDSVKRLENEIEDYVIELKTLCEMEKKNYRIKNKNSQKKSDPKLMPSCATLKKMPVF